MKLHQTKLYMFFSGMIINITLKVG